MKRVAIRTGCFVLAAMLGLSLLGGCPAPTPSDSDGGSNTDDGGGGGGGGGGDGDGGGGGDDGGDGSNSSPTASFVIQPSAGLKPAQAVTMDGSASSDPDGDTLTYAWSQTAGEAVTLSASDTPSVTFTSPAVVQNSEIKFSLTVSDGRGGQHAVEHAVVVEVAAEFAGYAQALSPYRESLTSDEAYHLLRRTSFGASPERVAQAVRDGLTATVNDLMTIKADTTVETALVEAYENECMKQWLVHMMEGQNPLRERIALFWHDRFATSRRALEGSYEELAVQHMEMLRRNALGNYRQFLEELTLDPVMLLWLNGADSPKQRPNENYTREFWELFTLGRDTLYTEDDIKEGARAFTGITLFYDWPNMPRPIYDLTNHDETMKAVFPGRASAANYNYESVIDLTLAQAEASHYVGRNLFVALVHDEPSQAVVEALAQTLVDSGFEIAPVVRQILMSQAMFSDFCRGRQISSPVEHWIGVARTLDMHLHSEDSQGYLFDHTAWLLSRAGQELMNPPGVEGWHEDDGWLEDQWILNRVDALGRTMEYGPDRTSDIPYHLLPATDRWDERDVREEIVNAVASIFHVPLTDQEREIYVEVLDQNGYLAFHLEDLEYQPRHVFELIRLMAMDERVIGR